MPAWKSSCCVLVLVLGGSGCSVTDRDFEKPPGARCGDGKIDPGEVCDNGERNSDTTPDACRTSCTLPTCGDGVVDGDEACDGPSADPHQMCGTSCKARGCAVGVDYPSIQAALADTACNEILLPEGTYPELVTIERNVTLSGDMPVAPGSASGAVIDGGGTGTVITIAKGAVVTLARLKISNGSADVGGGVHNGGELTLKDSVIEQNVAKTAGAGVYNDHGTLVIDGSVILKNSAGSMSVSTPNARGGGIYADGGAVTLKNKSHVESNLAAASGGDDETVLAMGGGLSGKGASIAIDEASSVDHNSAAASAGTEGRAQGAGVHIAEGTLIVKGQSVIGDNTATGTSVVLGVAEGGGVYAASAEVSILGGSAINGNSAEGTTTDKSSPKISAEGRGGGLFTSKGKLTVDEKGALNGNTASAFGDVGWKASGGGLSAEGTSIVLQGGSVVTGNTAKSGGAGLPGASFSLASEGGGISLTTATLKLFQGEIRGNTAVSEGMLVSVSANGGGLHSLSSSIEITASKVSDNTADARTSSAKDAIAAGGGIECGSTDPLGQNLLTLDQSTVSNNLAVGTGKGMGDGGGMGGAIYNSTGIGAAGSHVIIRRSTLMLNAARGDGGQNSAASGGAIHTSANGNISVSTMEIENSTLSGNKAVGNLGGAEGAGKAVAGAILLAGGTGSSQAHLALSNTTITGNSAVGALLSSAGAIRLSGGTSSAITDAVMKNSLLWGNSAKTGPECQTLGTQLLSDGYNLFGDVTACSMISAMGDKPGIDPQIEPLGENGGITQTHAIKPTSPARDGGNPAGCKDANKKDLPADQRDKPRVGVCDIGAYEYSP